MAPRTLPSCRCADSGAAGALASMEAWQQLVFLVAWPPPHAPPLLPRLHRRPLPLQDASNASTRSSHQARAHC